MAPGARFVFVMLANDPRTEQAPVAAGLTVVERWDYVFGRKGTTLPHIATLVCARSEDVEGPVQRRTGKLVIRGPDGEWTDAYLEFRQRMGIT
jgi:hypothetical protein